eukprot:gene9597-biopygen5806
MRAIDLMRTRYPAMPVSDTLDVSVRSGRSFPRDGAQQIRTRLTLSPNSDDEKERISAMETFAESLLGRRPNATAVTVTEKRLIGYVTIPEYSMRVNLREETERTEERRPVKSVIDDSEVALSLSEKHRVMEMYWRLLALGDDAAIPGAVSITDNKYTVTEKADGERRLMVVDDEGRLFTLDDRLGVHAFATKYSASTEYRQCLLDGEYVVDHTGIRHHLIFAVFDVYVANGKSHAAAVLRRRDSGLYPYHLDGLVFTPADFQLEGPSTMPNAQVRFPASERGERLADHETAPIRQRVDLLVGYNTDSVGGNDGTLRPALVLGGFSLRGCPSASVTTRRNSAAATGRVTANNYETAMNVWRTIMHPVYEAIITGEETLDEASARAELVKSVYFITRMRTDEGGMVVMRKFHSYVKAHLISSFAGASPRIFDFGVGKAGDLHKWIRAGASKVAGIDKFSSNLTDPVNGEYARALQTKGAAVLRTGFCTAETAETPAAGVVRALGLVGGFWADASGVVSSFGRGTGLGLVSGFALGSAAGPSFFEGFGDTARIREGVGLESFGYHVSTGSTGSSDFLGTPDDHLTGLESFRYHVSTVSTGSSDFLGTPDDHLTGLESFGYHVSTGAPN